MNTEETQIIIVFHDLTWNYQKDIDIPDNDQYTLLGFNVEDTEEDIDKWVRSMGKLIQNLIEYGD